MKPRRFRGIVISGVFLAAFFACLTSAEGQTWRKIGTLPAEASCSYFWDTAHGVVGGKGFIYYYSNGTWTQSTYPETPNYIFSLRLLKPGLLYAAQGSSQIWVSSDSGKNWQLTGISASYAQELYLMKDSSIQVVSGWPYMGVPDYFEGGGTFARLDSNICVLTHDDSSMGASYSRDGGRNWLASKGVNGNYGAYGCYADTCSKIFYLGNENGSVMFSSDSGANWSLTTGQPGINHTDVLDGVGGALYCLSQAFGISGSIDGGYTWSSIGGPSCGEDTRMFLFGDHGQYLITYSGYRAPNSGVWLCIDPSISLKSRSPIFVHDTIGSGCNLTQVSITVLGTAAKQTIHLTATGDNNHQLSPRDTTFTPSSFNTVQYTMQPPSTLPVRYHIHADVQTGCRSFPWDTSFVAGTTPKFVALQPGSAGISACDSVRIPITINSNRCDSLFLDSTSIWANGLGAMSLYSVNVHRLLHGENDTLWFEYSPRGHVEDRLYQVHLVGRFVSSGDLFDTLLTIHAASYPRGNTRASVQRVISIRACTPVRIPLILHAPPCDFAIWNSVNIENSTGNVSVESPPTDTLLPGMADTIWITVNPSMPGSSWFAVHIHATALQSGLAIDTEIVVQTNVAGLNSTIIRAPGSLTLSNCKNSVVPIILNALDCDSIEFSSCTLMIDKSISYSTNRTFPRSLPIGESDTLLTNFPPQNLSKATIIFARFKGKYLGSDVNFDTTIQIRVSFTSSAAALIANSDAFSLDTVSTCGVRDTMIFFANLGCDTITVTKDVTVWQPGWSSFDPTLPIVLPPDSGFWVKVQYTPSVPGPSTQYMKYTFDTRNTTGLSSEDMLVTATAVPGEAILSIVNPLLNFGTMTMCHADSSLTFTLSNTGCDTLKLTGAYIDSTGNFTSGDVGNISLAPQGSRQYTVHFTSTVVGVFHGAFHTHAAGGYGQASHDTTIDFAANVIHGLREASLSLNAIDFGITSICEERDSSIIITNKGCDTLRIDSTQFSNAHFIFADTVHFPIVLFPNASASFPVVTHLDTAGHPIGVTGSLSFFSNSDIPVPPIALTRSVSYPGRFSLAMSVEDSARASATVPVYVMRRGTIPKLADSIGFDLVYNESVLTFKSAVQTDIQTTGSQLLSNGLMARSFSMRPASDRDTIATLTFTSFLSREDSTPLTLSAQKFYSAGALSPPCIASLDTSALAGNFSLELVCGNGALRSALNDLPIDLTSMEVSDQVLAITIRQNSPAISACSAEIFNVMGQSVAKMIVSLAQGNNSVALDVSQLPSGAYFLRIADGELAISRRFVVMR